MFVRVVCLQILLHITTIKAQLSLLDGVESTVRNSNSVEIQACLNPNVVMSVQLDQVKETLYTDLKSILKSSAVFYVKTYTNTASESGTVVVGGTCFMFVYQAISPELARDGVYMISVFPKQIQLTSNDYSTIPVPVNVKAFPWKATEDTFLNLGWSVKGSDLILWGACVGGLLFICTIGVCLFVQLSISREHTLAQKLLEKDRALFIHVNSKQKDKKKDADDDNNHDI